jgi:hypothetical protein
VVIIFCVVAGTASEKVQSVFGRHASIGDVLKDVVGGVLALAWFAPAMDRMSRITRRAFRGLSVLVLFLMCLPLAVALIDEVFAKTQFPVLSDFETPFERDRWEGGARFSIDRSVANHGKASLRVEMDTSFYSDIRLVHFPRNWTGSRFLRMDVFNPSSEEIVISCKIHDRQHEDGTRHYGDRYNEVVRFKSGWNDLRIDLGEVARAPVGRPMDLAQMREVTLFSHKLPALRTIFVDHVRLE